MIVGRGKICMGAECKRARGREREKKYRGALFPKAKKEPCPICGAAAAKGRAVTCGTETCMAEYKKRHSQSYEQRRPKERFFAVLDPEHPVGQPKERPDTRPLWLRENPDYIQKQAELDAVWPSWRTE